MRLNFCCSLLFADSFRIGEAFCYPLRRVTFAINLVLTASADGGNIWELSRQVLSEMELKKH